MPDLTPFETHLTELLEAESLGGIRPIDRYAVARSVMAGRRRGWWAGGSAVGSAVPRWSRPLLVAVLVALLAAASIAVGSALLVRVSPAPRGLTVERTGSMAYHRSHHAATRLLDGRVLITGGWNGGSGPGVTKGGLERINLTAELYDPATGRFETTGDPVAARWNHTSTLLADGRVLLVGGGNGDPGAELYDPATGRFTATGGPPLARSGSTALRLADGRVAIVGAGEEELAAGIEIYDPATGSFTAGPTNDLFARHDPRAVLLPDGRVLIAGGAGGPGSEGFVYEHAAIWDPATDAVIDVGALPGPTSPLPDPARAIGVHPTYAPDVDHVGGMVVRPDGRVLFLLLDHRLTWSVQAFDPATLAFTPIAALPGDPTLDPVLLDDGRVLVNRLDAGGCCGVRAGVLDPVTGELTGIGAVAGLGGVVGGTAATVTTLDDGSVLIAGGESSSGETLGWAWVVREDGTAPPQGSPSSTGPATSMPQRRAISRPIAIQRTTNGTRQAPAGRRHTGRQREAGTCDPRYGRPDRAEPLARPTRAGPRRAARWACADRGGCPSSACRRARSGSWALGSCRGWSDGSTRCWPGSWPCGPMTTCWTSAVGPRDCSRSTRRRSGR